MHSLWKDWWCKNVCTPTPNKIGEIFGILRVLRMDLPSYVFVLVKVSLPPINPPCYDQQGRICFNAVNTNCPRGTDFLIHSQGKDWLWKNVRWGWISQYLPSFGGAQIQCIVQDWLILDSSDLLSTAMYQITLRVNLLPWAVLTTVANGYYSAAMVLGYCDTVILYCCGALILRYLDIETLWV